MHRGTTVHRHDLSGQPGSLRQVRGSHVQHPSALLRQHGQVLPGGLGILLPLSLTGCIKGVVGGLRFPASNTSQVISYPFSLADADRTSPGSVRPVGGYNGAMDLDDAERALADAELQLCLQASLGDAKEVRDACLQADIPVLLDRGSCCGQSGCGCAPKIDLLARSEDVPRVARLLEERWRALALREGTIDARHPAVAAPAPAGADAVPCPACGTAAPLADGACTDCGLQLA
jgi:hypothetical protein